MRILIIAVLLVPLCASAAEWRWTGVERIVALSDVHGAYDAMVRTLQNAEVVDDDLAWKGESTHLVITGDILDRGADSRQVMDLLMRLEDEARKADGRVHLLLGNHEVMNLTGDLRYVAAAEYAAFAEEENPADREQGFETFRASQSVAGEAPDEAVLRREFDLRAPPGYFGHRRAFAPEGRYGKWLLEKPLLVVINETAFVHGGLSPMVTELGLDGVNGELKFQVAAYAAHLAVLTRAGVLDPTENFYSHAAILDELPDDEQRPAEVQDAIEGAIRLNGASVHDSASPVWYRGNVGCGELIESDKLDAALAAIGATRVVIGHTPTLGRRVLQRLDGRVVEIDTGMLTESYGGSGHALIVEGERVQVVSEAGSDRSSPESHPRHAGPGVGVMPAAELERLLATGDIVSSTVDESGRKIVGIQDGGTTVTAQFLKNPRGRAPELAAYRLDRMLNLDMVPVTVAREVDGDKGSVQLLPDTAQNEVTRATSGEGASAWCPLPEQWNAMYVFDALSFNAARDPQSMLYSPADWQLMVIGHAEAFGTRSGRPPWLKGVDLTIGRAWTDALTSLSDELLQGRFSDTLDKRRLRALGKRRDELLQEAAEAGVAAAQR